MTHPDGANADRSERRKRLGGEALEAVSLCAAVAGTIALLAQNLVIACIAHLLAAITGGWAGAIADRRRLGSHYFPWIMAFCMPLWGGSAACFLLETMKKPRPGKLREGYAAYLNDAASYRESVPVMDGRPATDPVSLADVLSNPASDAEQRIAVEYLCDMETQGGCEILRRAVSSPDREAYFFAMTAMTQMEDRMRAQLDELEDAIAEAGKSGADAVSLLKTAKAYVDFIYYEFAAGERKSEYLHRAQTLLRNVLDNSPPRSKENNEAMILLGRVKLKLDDFEGAAKCFGDYIDQNPGLISGYLWRAEAWHRLGEYDRLRKDCRIALEMGNVPPNMRLVLDFWLPEQGQARSAAEAPIKICQACPEIER